MMASLAQPNARDGARWMAATLLAALVVAALSAVSPGLAILLTVAPVGLLVLSPRGRLFLFIFGGLLVFGKESAINLPKMAYLGLAGVSAVVAWVRLERYRGNAFRRRLAGTQLVIVLVCISAVVGLARGASAIDVSRDGVTYLLLASSVPIGLDAGTHFTPRRVSQLAIVAASLSSISFMVSVGSARGVSLLPVDRIALGSMFVTGVGVAIACSIAAAESPQLRIWGLLAALALAMPILVSGTRTGLMLSGGLAAGLVGQRRSFRILRSVALLLVAPLVVITAVHAVGPRLVDGDFVSGRIDSLRMLASGDYRADMSAVDRLKDYAIAAEYTDAAPFTGQGLGAISSSGDPLNEQTVPTFYLDTPMLFTAKFGVPGATLILIALALMILPSRKETGAESLRLRATSVGFASMCVLVIPFSAMTEDKGFALAIALLSALASSVAGVGGEQRSPSANDQRELV